MNFSEFTAKSIEEIFKILKSGEKGLDGEEAKERQRIYGLNELEIKKTKTFDILIRQLKSAFFYLLFVAAIVYFLFGELVNGFLILVFVFINVSLGFFQEYRAEKAVQLLKIYLPQKVRVIRGGEERAIDKKFLIPGDIVLLESGNIIPADLRVLKAKNFLVDESVLTGESAPQTKISETLPEETKEIFEAKNIVFAGTSVISGEAEGIVIAAGKSTLFGRIVKSVNKTFHQSAYEKSLLNFSS